MGIIIEQDTAPAPEVFEPIRAALVAYNQSVVRDDRRRGDYAITLRDDSLGGISGGLWARCYFDWMFIQLLSVPEVARGRGAAATSWAGPRRTPAPTG